MSLTIDHIKACRWIAEDLKLLARLHAFEIDASNLEKLAESRFPESLAIDFDSSQEPIAPVMAATLNLWSKEQSSLDNLAADFAAIYLNGTYELSPNESAWLDDDHLERQEPMFEVRNWYSKYQLQVPQWRVRQEDNIAQQLLFISHLFERESIPFADVSHFMDFHLLRWIDSFAEAVFQRSETPFYASLSIITQRYINELRAIVAEIEEKPRPSKEEINKITAKETQSMAFDPVFYSSQEGGW